MIKISMWQYHTFAHCAVFVEICVFLKYYADIQIFHFQKSMVIPYFFENGCFSCYITENLWLTLSIKTYLLGHTANALVLLLHGSEFV